MGILEGKNILVTGVTMRTSIAYAAVEIAQLATRQMRAVRDEALLGACVEQIEARAEELQKELDSQRHQGNSLKAADALLKLALGKQENRRFYYTPLSRVHQNAAP